MSQDNKLTEEEIITLDLKIGMTNDSINEALMDEGIYSDDYIETLRSELNLLRKLKRIANETK